MWRRDRVLAWPMRGPRFSLCPNVKIMAIREHISLIFNFLGNGFVFIIVIILILGACTSIVLESKVKWLYKLCYKETVPKVHTICFQFPRTIF